MFFSWAFLSITSTGLRLLVDAFFHILYFKVRALGFAFKHSCKMFLEQDGCLQGIRVKVLWTVHVVSVLVHQPMEFVPEFWISAMLSASVRCIPFPGKMSFCFNMDCVELYLSILAY